MKKSILRIIASALAVACTGSLMAACDSASQNEQQIEAPEGYTLVWHDEFDGDSLNEEDWNREFHPSGYVNNERQTYLMDPEYAYVENGDLVIQPVRRVEENGRVSYASGRINTMRHQTFTYGRIEARIRVPQGQGFLPAFWMMPQNDTTYGSWPRGGEIDIMEVLGNDTVTTYGTIHYGNPHRENQGIYTLDEGDFASDYHVFAVEWEPGEIRWYVDDVMFFSTNDWYSVTEGFDPKPYPAPFNQPFYIILNVAVGGNWPGDPTDETPFDERAQMRVDYVRVFQRDSYDENVTRPEPVLNMRDADETGNYVVNGLFERGESLSDNEGWRYINNAGGDGEASIIDGHVEIVTNDAGSEDYAIQLMQAGLPMFEGGHYTLSFDAWADEDRQMNVDVSGPDLNYIRYMEDTTVELTTASGHFEFEFDMTEESDDNGRIEFNMGDTSSTATIYITNVRLEQAG
ncbi:MAG: family 16 glycosylhydrolase [Clostridiales bacterium]|nr:family 16 glycosylhydrolase [Clostridiales bacterium]